MKIIATSVQEFNLELEYVELFYSILSFALFVSIEPALTFQPKSLISFASISHLGFSMASTL